MLHDDESNTIVARKENDAGLSREYEAKIFCDLIHPEGAEVLAEYGAHFYKGRAACTVNSFGDGTAYYIASRNDDRFFSDFYGRLTADLDIARILDTDLPEGVTVQQRTDGERRFIFILNFTRDEQKLDLGRTTLRDMLTNDTLTGPITLEGYGSLVCEPASAP